MASSVLPVQATQRDRAEASLLDGLAKVERDELDPNAIYAKGHTLLKMALNMGHSRAAHGLLNSPRMDANAQVYKNEGVVDVAVRKASFELVKRMVEMGFPLLGKHCFADKGASCFAGLFCNAIAHAELSAVQLIYNCRKPDDTLELFLDAVWQCATVFARHDVFSWVYTNLVKGMPVDHAKALANAIAHGRQARSIWFFTAGLCDAAAVMPAGLSVLGFAASRKAAGVVRYVLKAFGVAPFAESPFPRIDQRPAVFPRTYSGLAFPDVGIMTMLEEHGLLYLNSKLHLSDLIYFMRRIKDDAPYAPALPILQLLNKWDVVRLLGANRYNTNVVLDFIRDVVFACSGFCGRIEGAFAVELDTFLRRAHAMTLDRFPLVSAIQAAGDCGDDGELARHIVQACPVPDELDRRNELSRELYEYMTAHLEGNRLPVGKLRVLLEYYKTIEYDPWNDERVELLLRALGQNWKCAAAILDAGWTAVRVSIGNVMRIFSLLVRRVGVQGLALGNLSDFLGTMLVRIVHARKWQEDEMAALARALLCVANDLNMQVECVQHADYLFAQGRCFDVLDLICGLDGTRGVIFQVRYLHNNVCMLLRLPQLNNNAVVAKQALKTARRFVTLTSMQHACVPEHRARCPRIFEDLDQCASYNTYRKEHTTFQTKLVCSFPLVVRRVLVTLLLIARAKKPKYSLEAKLFERCHWSVLSRLFYILTRHPVDWFEYQRELQ